MKLQQLFEAKVGAKSSGLAMDKMVSYLSRKVGGTLIKIPGVEHFNNSESHGYGIRYVFSGSTRCIRFNWNSDGAAGKTAELSSIDIFTGKTRDPNFTIHTKGLSLVRALPVVATILRSPTLGKQFVFPIDPAAAIAGDTGGEAVTEAKKDDFTAEEALNDFMKKLATGKSFTRSEFIGMYHIVNAGIFDTIVTDFPDRFKIDNKRVGLLTNAKIDQLKGSILAKAGIIEVTAGGTGETYAKSKQEDDLEKDAGDRVPYADTLEHLEGLVQALIKGSYNALFVAGKGGCVSGETMVNIIIEDPTHDLNQAKDTSANNDLHN